MGKIPALINLFILISSLVLTPLLYAQAGAPINPIIQQLQRGLPAIGTFTRDPSPTLDFVIIDEQYGEFDIDGVRVALSGMQASDGSPAAAPIVRIPLAVREAPQAVVRQLLDAGVFGIMFPDIETRAQAVTAIGSMRFTQAPGSANQLPTGLRGSGSGSGAGSNPASGLSMAAQYWGLSAEDYLASADVWPLDPAGKLVAMIQIESPAGIENLQAILEVPGIAVIFLGPTDLATAIGAEGPNDPRVETLVQEVLGVCRARNVPCGYPIVADSRADAERETARRLAEGFKVLAVMTRAR